MPHIVNSYTVNAWTTAPPGLSRPKSSVVDERQSVVTVSEESSSSSSNSIYILTTPPADMNLFDPDVIPIADLVIANETNRDEAIVDSLWDTPDDDKEKQVTEPICEVHQRVCKKGICRAYAHQLKKIEAAKRGEGQSDERGRKMNKGKGRGRGG